MKSDPRFRNNLTGWTLDDPRHKARSLMSRAGVSADIAERCIGQVISGVRDKYDRNAYFDKKEGRLRSAGLFSSQWRRGSWRMRLRSRAARQRAFRMFEPPAARIRL